MSDLKQEALEAAIRAYGPSYSDHTHQLDLSAACEAYYEALRAGEATAFQVTDEAIDGAIGAYDAWDSKWEAMRHALNSFAQRPAQPAGVGCPVVPVDDGAVMARQLVEKGPEYHVANALAEFEERGASRERAAVVADLSAQREALLKHESENNEEGSTYADRELIASFIGRLSRCEHLKPCAESQGQGAPTSPKG